MIHTYVTFDPRTKMLLLMTMAIFVLGGAGDKLFGAYLPLFCLLPFVLFILVGKWKRVTYESIISWNQKNKREPGSR